MINCVLIEWNAAHDNYTIVNMNAVISNPVVEGLSPNLEFLVKRIPFGVPEYDPRLTNMVTTQDVGDLDTEYPTLKQWVTTYTLVPRTADEKKVSVAEAESLANYNVFPQAKQLKLITLALAILARKVSGMTISDAQQLILDKLQNRGQRIWQNHIIAAQKQELLDADDPCDLDSDWITTDSDDEA